MRTLLFISTLMMLLGCDAELNQKEDKASTEMEESTMKNNPFSEESTLPYFTPDFSKIKTEHFMPAFTEGMKQQNVVIQEIISTTQPPTFENTILPLETSGELLTRVGSVFFALTGAHTNEEIQAIQEELSPKLAAQRDGIFLNKELFDRIESIYLQRKTINLDDESLALLENYYNDFVKAGAKLTTKEKEEMMAINKKIASLSTEFGQKLLDGTNEASIFIEDKALLDGLTESQIENLKDGDGYKISITNTTQQPLLQSFSNRELREKIFNSSLHRTDKGANSTLAIISEIAELRAEKAQLLGFENYAEWNLVGTMVKQPKVVKEMFAGLVPATIAKAKVEMADIQDMIDSEGEEFKMKAWDWAYYAEKVRKKRYDLDEEQIKPYFELKNVLENGVFYAAQRLYGIYAEERTGDFPTYHPDVIVYELFEEDGSPLGLFYGDYFARDSKRGGAWMSNFVDQSKLYDRKPVVYNVMNVPKPAEGQPALMTYDEVETMFHEMGHALHGLFADQTYPSISGTNVARDFVEFPSQVNENWALHPEVLANYAIHYDTGKPIPAELVQKIKNASTFNQGFALTELLAAANLDMEWHTISSDQKIKDAIAFEKDALNATGLDAVSAIPPRYSSPYFNHIWGSGYAAGYYSYVWTEMLSHDAYDWFKENGGLTRENGDRYRAMVLSQGDTQDYETMYNSWRGKEPSVTPMEKARGLRD